MENNAKAIIMHLSMCGDATDIAYPIRTYGYYHRVTYILLVMVISHFNLSPHNSFLEAPFNP